MVSAWSHTPALGQGNAEHRKVLGADVVQAHFGLLGGGAAADLDPGIAAVAGGRGVGGDARLDNLGHGADPGADLLEVLAPVLPGHVGVLVDGDRDGHGVVGIVAEFRIHQPEEAFRGRARHGEQKQCERHLDGDHGAVRAPAVHAPQDAAHAGLHEAAEVRPGELNRGREAKHDRRGEGQADTEQQDRRIDGDDRFGGEGILREPRGNSGKALPREHHAQPGPRDCQRQRLGEQLADDSRPAGPDGRAQGEFVLPVRAAGQEQDRHVGAPDEEQRGHRPEQQKQRRPEGLRVHVRDAAQIDAKRFRVARRRLPGELLEDRL